MNIAITPLINGKEWEWANIVVNILGVPIVGITSIEYGMKQNMENVYGAGSAVISRVYGKEEPTAKITILKSELQNLMQAAPNGVLQRIPEFDITVMYIDDVLVPVKHKIRNVRFMNNDRKSATGDGAISVELELICSHIEWQ